MEVLRGQFLAFASCSKVGADRVERVPLLDGFRLKGRTHACDGATKPLKSRGFLVVLLVPDHILNELCLEQAMAVTFDQRYKTACAFSVGGQQALMHLQVGDLVECGPPQQCLQRVRLAIERFQTFPRIPISQKRVDDGLCLGVLGVAAECDEFLRSPAD